MNNRELLKGDMIKIQKWIWRMQWHWKADSKANIVSCCGFCLIAPNRNETKLALMQRFRLTVWMPAKNGSTSVVGLKPDAYVSMVVIWIGDDSIVSLQDVLFVPGICS
jgi:hypothetical protein